MTKDKQETSGLHVGCGCLTLVVALYLAMNLVRCVFTPSVPPAPPEGPAAQPESSAAQPGLVEQFAGQYVSDTGRTKYELNVSEKRFSFYTTIGSRLLLQTQIAPFEVREMDNAGMMIEVLGDDHQAGGAPAARFRITKGSDGSFKLERVKPVGGSLGVFRKQI